MSLGLVHVKSQGSTASPQSAVPVMVLNQVEVRDESGLGIASACFDGVAPEILSCRLMPLWSGFTWPQALFVDCFVKRGMLAMGQSLTQFSGGLVGVVGVLPGGSFAMGIQCLGGGFVFLADDVMLQDVGMRGQNLIIQAASVFNSVPTVSNPGGHGVFAGGSNVGYVGGTVSLTQILLWQAAPALGLWERRRRCRYRLGSAACIQHRHVPNGYRRAR